MTRGKHSEQNNVGTSFVSPRGSMILGRAGSISMCPNILHQEFAFYHKSIGNSNIL